MDSSQIISSTFTEKTDLLLSELMQKYKLEEPLEKTIKKIKEGKPDNTLIFTKIIMDFYRQKISDKELADLLQKEFAVSQQIAEQISKEIIDNIIPTLWEAEKENVREKDNSLYNNKNTHIAQKTPLKNLEKSEIKKSDHNPIRSKEKDITAPKEIKNFDRPSPKADQQKTIKNNKSDKYREQI